MPRATVTLDTSKFEAAVKFVFNNTRRALPEIINRAALVTLIGGKGVEGAMKRTRRAAKDAIMAVPNVAIAAYLRGRGVKLSGKALAEAVKKERKRRVAAIGYTAVAGWAKAAGDLGSSKKLRSGKGWASLGYATPAKYGHFEVIMVNSTPAAQMIGATPLQDALNDTAEEMVIYWQQQTGKIFRP